MLRLGTLCFSFIFLVGWISQGQSFPIDYDVDLLRQYFSRDIRASTKRDLTPEEKDLVERTRAHLAEVIQKNLIRLLSVYTRGSRGQERLEDGEDVSIDEESQSRGQGRQDDGDDGDNDEEPQFNPNTLPQVAALLATIFSGNLNLTGVVDKAFFLVPDVVRKQVSGIVKLISGKPDEEPTTPAKIEVSTTLRPLRVRPLYTTTATPAPIVRNDSAAVSEEPLSTTTFRPYRTTKAVRRKWPNAPDIAVPPREIRELEGEGRSDLDFGRNEGLTEEDAVEAVENEILSDAKWYEAYINSKSPRYFLDPLRKIFKSEDFNLTTVYKVMPELFKGARQAFVLLESLGQVTGLTGLTGLSEDIDE